MVKIHSHTILIGDLTDVQVEAVLEYFHAAGIVIKKYKCTDVSDVSGHFDDVHAFTFYESNKEVVKQIELLFKLKFSK